MTAALCKVQDVDKIFLQVSKQVSETNDSHKTISLQVMVVVCHAGLSPANFKIIWQKYNY